MRSAGERTRSEQLKEDTEGKAPILSMGALAFLLKKFRLLSRDRKSSEQFTCFNRRYHEIKAELALSGIVPSMMSEVNQEEAI